MFHSSYLVMRFCDELPYLIYSLVSQLGKMKLVSVNTENSNTSQKYLKKIPKKNSNSLGFLVIVFIVIVWLLTLYLLYRFRFWDGDSPKKNCCIQNDQRFCYKKSFNSCFFHCCSMLCLAARTMFSLSNILSGHITSLTSW